MFKNLYWISIYKNIKSFLKFFYNNYNYFLIIITLKLSKFRINNKVYEILIKIDFCKNC